MPNSKLKERARGRARRQAQKRAAGAHLLSTADVRAMRKAGLRPDDLEGEQGQAVTFQVFSAMLRDRDAIRAHMGWHHDSMKNPDVATILERASREKAMPAEQRIMALEADLARLEALFGSPDRRDLLGHEEREAKE